MPKNSFGALLFSMIKAIYLQGESIKYSIMKRFFVSLFSLFLFGAVLGAESYTAMDIKPGDYVLWDAKKCYYVAIDGGNRGDGKCVYVDINGQGYSNAIEETVGVIMYVFPEGEIPGQKTETVVVKDGWKAAPHVLVYNFEDQQYYSSALRSLELPGIHSRDGRTVRHAYVMSIRNSDRTWVYSSDDDSIVKIEYSGTTNGQYWIGWQRIREEKDNDTFDYTYDYSSTQNNHINKYMVGETGYDLKLAVTQYNDRRGKSHRIKPNHWALEYDRECLLLGITSGWYVPTVAEINRIGNSGKALLFSMTRLATYRHKDCELLDANKDYWTIQENNFCSAYVWRINSDNQVETHTEYKSKSRYVRLIMAL